jgi:hypothetical protein
LVSLTGAVVGVRAKRSEGEHVKRLAAFVALVSAALVQAPVAQAQMFPGNYELQIQGRYDFHTWLWNVYPCGTSGCYWVNAIPRPIAKAFSYRGQAQLAEGRYTLIVDDPFGLRCGDVYYGPTIPTHDVYSWDPASLAGTLESSFDTGCDGTPGGTNAYPFTLVKY